MAHELEIVDGKASFAYVGDAPWHGLGQELTTGQPLEVWAREAGMDYYIESAAVHYPSPTGEKMNEFTGKKVLFRNDNGAPLAVVSDRYKVVQPMEVLEFFRELTEQHGLELETAGVLYKGQKYFALAKTGQEVRIAGTDVIKNYVLLATSCDGTLRTLAKRTSVRVVCNNTLSYAASNGEDEIRISHASSFNAAKVQSELGFDNGWAEYADLLAALAARNVSNQEAIQYVLTMFGDPMKPIEQQTTINTIAKVLQLFDGDGMGSQLRSAKGTAFGLLQATTEYIDHHKGKDQSRRLDNAWFLSGANFKQQAFNQAVELLAA